MTYVTCPIRLITRLRGAKAATMQLLSDGRFTLGLGAGENLNEHIVGGQWPLARLPAGTPRQRDPVRASQGPRAGRDAGT
jgi:hypothetical protein